MLDGFLKDWWPAIAAAIAGITGFKISQERNRWRLDQMVRDVDGLKEDVAALKTDRVEHGTTLAIIQVSLTQIKETLEQMREEMRGKADK